VGPTVSEREGEDGGTGSVCFPGLRAGSSAGPKVTPWPFYYFYFFFLFFFFCFPISFIAFAKLLQIKPNHFHKFCKNHSKVLNQYETCFQNQNKIFNKRSQSSLMALLA
jgi:hypothetical protein